MPHWQLLPVGMSVWRGSFCWAAPQQVSPPLLLGCGQAHRGICPGPYSNGPNSWQNIIPGLLSRVSQPSRNLASRLQPGGGEQWARPQERGSFSSLTVKICVNNTRGKKKTVHDTRVRSWDAFKPHGLTVKGPTICHHIKYIFSKSSCFHI